VTVSATLSTIWRTLRSRSGAPRWPRKYFWATIVVALRDQVTGNSTSRCSNATRPVFQSVITASRSSHSSSS
jgi:hypothetical protein